MAAVIGDGAAGALIALAITSHRSANRTLDRRLLSEFNRQSEDLVRSGLDPAEVNR